MVADESKEVPPYYMTPRQVRRQYAPVVGPIAWSTYDALVDRWNEVDKAAWPSLPTLASYVGVSRRRVFDAIDRLTGKDGVLGRHGLAPLVVKGKYQADARARGGLENNEYYLPIHEEFYETVIVASKKRKKRSRPPPSRG